MSSSDAQKRASAKWQKENMSRVALDVSKPYHTYLKEIAAENGYTVGAFIKDAIREKIERDGIRRYVP